MKSFIFGQSLLCRLLSLLLSFHLSIFFSAFFWFIFSHLFNWLNNHNLTVMIKGLYPHTQSLTLSCLFQIVHSQWSGRHFSILPPNGTCERCAMNFCDTRAWCWPPAQKTPMGNIRHRLHLVKGTAASKKTFWISWKRREVRKSCSYQCQWLWNKICRCYQMCLRMVPLLAGTWAEHK